MLEQENKMSNEEKELYEFAMKVRDAVVNQYGALTNNYQRGRLYTTRDVKMMTKNPYQYKKELQEMSEYLSETEGLLKEIIMYKSNPLTLDHFILPLDASKYKKKTKLEKDEYATALKLDKYHLKYNLSWMIKRLMILGELFLYKVEGDKAVTFYEMPSRICTIIGKKNDVFKYAINLSAISSTEVKYYPEEIQMIYSEYIKNGLKDNPKMIDGVYYVLDENAFAFCLNQSGKALPYYIGLFEDLYTLKDMKEAQRVSGILENFKILIQKIPTDTEGNLLITRKTAEMFNDALKKIVPDGVGVLTTPLSISDVSVNGVNSNRTINYVENARNTLYSSAGINDEVFNGSKSSNDAMIISAMADTILAKTLLRQFEIWINEELSMDSKTDNWRIKFLNTTEKDREADLQNMTNRLAVYGSKRMYMAMQGFTPLESINLIKYEKELKLEEDMIPMSTSYTQSSDEGGRPTNAESSDTTKQSSDSEN